MNTIDPGVAPAASPQAGSGTPLSRPADDAERAAGAAPPTPAQSSPTEQEDDAQPSHTAPAEAPPRPSWRRAVGRLFGEGWQDSRMGQTKPAPQQRAPAPGADTSSGAEYASAIPATLRQRYLVTEDGKYYFRDREQTLAFEDSGQRLHTHHDDADVAASMVELAQAKGWTQLKLRGSAAFKRAAWLAAAERGLQVKGYRPQALDKARLAERRAARAQQASQPEAANSIAPLRASAGAEAAANPDPPTPNQEPHPPHLQAMEQLQRFLRQRGDSESAVAMTMQLAGDQLARHRTHFGRLLEHGAACYQFDRHNDLSYFVTLETPGGRQTIWGLDLERALRDSGAAIGDGIVLSQRGGRPPHVTGLERDHSGKPTGKRQAIGAERHHWEVLSLDNARDFCAPQRQSHPGGPAGLAPDHAQQPHPPNQSPAARTPERARQREP